MNAFLIVCLALAQSGAGLTPEELAKLPPDGGPQFNRLIFERSPYLLQHARNPVDWYPWGASARARAKELGRPIFLSIGYSTCHWCHVMERECFEDAEVAALLEKSFVAVKVDREERPDVDQVYMTCCTALTGSGGWPLTIVMTPDGQPFFAGTYFPKQDAGGQPGLLSVLGTLSKAWAEQHEAVLAHAQQLLELVRSDVQPTPGEIDTPAVLERAARALARSFDAENGGFGRAPKFPMVSSLRLLRRWSERAGDGQARFMLDRTLDGMACGGIHDQLGGGFHRYSTDREWLVPHFEKMLYDQALLALAYVEAFEDTRKPEWKEVATHVFDYVLGTLRAPEGGFYSAEDADSEGEEGRFYLWTRAELCGPTEAACAASVLWNIDGARIPHLRRPYVLEAPDAARAASRSALAARRAQRVRPLRDEKILTDWNGLMIAALARGGAAFGSPRHVAAAEQAADFALTRLRREDGRLWKRWAGGQAAPDGVLDDYACLIFGLIELYQADGDARWLREALQLADMLLGQFRQDKEGGFFLSSHLSEPLLLRTTSSADGTLPAGSALAIEDLLRLARLTGSQEYEQRAVQALRATAKDVERDPIGHAELLVAHDLARGPALEIVVAGPRADALTAELLQRVRACFLPNAVVILRPTDEPAPEITKLAPWTAALVAKDGRATAYVCRGHVCSLPTSDPEQLARQLEHPYGPAPPK